MWRVPRCVRIFIYLEFLCRCPCLCIIASQTEMFGLVVSMAQNWTKLDRFHPQLEAYNQFWMAEKFLLFFFFCNKCVVIGRCSASSQSQKCHILFLVTITMGAPNFCNSARSGSRPVQPCVSCSIELLHSDHLCYRMKRLFHSSVYTVRTRKPC